MDIAVLIIAIVSAASATAAVFYARRSSRASGRSADSAERSAAAAEEAVAYQRAEVERRRIDFELDWSGSGQAYVLSHIGTEPTYGVEVDTADLGFQGDTETSFDAWPAGHREQYLLSRGLDSTTTHIVVTWHALPDCSDPVQTKRLLVQM